MYTPKELEEMQNNVNVRDIRPEDITKELVDSPNAVFFSDLIKNNRSLFDKIVADPIVKKYGFLAGIGELQDIFYAPNAHFEIKAIQASRGTICFVFHENKKRVVKPYQLPTEKNIIEKMQALDLRPQQYPSIYPYITEEYIEGDLIPQIDIENKTDEDLHNIGISIGKTLRKLHRNDIVYNDTSICDDLGRSNIIISNNQEAVFIDYGVAIDISNVPNLSDEQILAHILTDPHCQLAAMMGKNIKDMIEEYKDHPPQKNFFIEKDHYFIEQGIQFLAQRLGKRVEHIRTGFWEAYTL